MKKSFLLLFFIYSSILFGVDIKWEIKGLPTYDMNVSLEDLEYEVIAIIEDDDYNSTELKVVIKPFSKYSIYTDGKKSDILSEYVLEVVSDPSNIISENKKYYTAKLKDSYFNITDKKEFTFLFKGGKVLIVKGHQYY